MKMPNNYSDEQLHLVARLYYVDGMPQNEVAKFAKVSQAKVSRLLTMARERGIVRITVADYEPRDRDMEARLRALLELPDVVVIKAAIGLAPEDLRNTLGLFGAPVLADFIKPKDVIALAGGRTIHALVENLPSPADRLLSVVQSMGSVDSNLNAFDSQEIGRMLARKLGGAFVAMNTPAFLPDKKMRDSLLKLEQVRVVHEHLDKANLAIVGVGTLENSVFVERNILGDDDKDELRDAGAIGEICGRFFNASGKECNTSWRERVMSVELEQLRRIPRVLGVISGNDRTAAIRAAIKGGLLKGLLMDESCARALFGDITEKKTSTPKKTKK
ncbi:MAG: hypothetical protein LBM04_07785 [Opitutaceae bacterium]|jgi:DNA-binding transcriptional regulator LsrR (DeoR family)|nr:hypothetical protein [Opitutaceae bacterium]